MKRFAITLNKRYRVMDGKPSIDLMLKSPHQLFDERDPSPFRERDLDDDAARYIVSSFRELSDDGQARLRLYFTGMGEFEQNWDVIPKAIHAHFEYESELKRRELRDTFKQGFISLAIGLTFLFAFTWFSQGVHQTENAGVFRSLLHEWMFIMGWVSMWRPINIFLYEWWPIHSAQRTLSALARIEIEVKNSVAAVPVKSMFEDAPGAVVPDPLPLARLKPS